MPTYNYECKVCGTVHEELRKIADCERGTICCDQEAKQVIITAPMFNDSFLGSAKNEGYVSPLSGDFISSTRARNNEMKKFDVVPKE